MGRRVLIINGHPDPAPSRFCAALCSAYATGATAAAREVRRLDIGALDIPLLRTAADFSDGVPCPAAVQAQDLVRWADHLLIVFPLWLGGPPAMLKAFFEQVFRYGFAIPRPGQTGALKGLLAGRTAHVVVTMGMPAILYRAAFGAFGVRALERGILWISGLRRIRRTLIGSVDSLSTEHRARMLHALERHGARGS